METTDPAPLEWGETPFDRMGREELLMHVWRLYAACDAARGILLTEQARRPEGDGYWTSGFGGRTCEMVTQALDAVPTCDEDRETLEKGFFRPANDLLFDVTKHKYIGFGWGVCEACGGCWGQRIEKGVETPLGPRSGPCPTPECAGTLRPLTWADVRPKDKPTP